MNVAYFPAGWYRDPSARHEQRYWDGVRWGPQVFDHGFASDDPAGATPVAPSTGWATSPAGAGYRCVRVGAWRLAILSAGGGLAAVAFLYEIFATVLAHGATWTRDEDWLFFTSWLFRPADFDTRITYVGYPPPGIFVALFLVFVFLSGVSIRQESALKKAGATGSHMWSPASEKEAWAVAVARLRAQTGGRLFNSIMRPHHRVFLVLEMVTAAAIVLMSGVAIAERTAIGIAGQAVRANLSVGMGPWVCLVAGVTLLVAAILAWPLTRHEILIRPDGTIEPVS